MNDMCFASDRLPTCRYFDAATERPAFVAEVPEWVSPALDAMIHGKKPIKLKRAEIEELGRAGIPLKSSRKGAALRAKIEAISLPPLPPYYEPDRAYRSRLPEQYTSS